MAQILVIDDEEMICQMVDRILHLCGHDVATARDGQTGIDLLRRKLFDLVITDVRMPRMSGLEVIKALRLIQPETRVIVMGGDGSVPAFGIDAFARAVGADHVLHKPFGAHDLNAAVSALLAPVPGK